MSYFTKNTLSPYQVFVNEQKEKMKKFNVPNKEIESQIYEIDKLINRTYSSLKNFETKKILVVGHVQGGKTDFVIGLNSKIIELSDNSKNVFIHLTFSNKKLSNQTYKRFDIFFNDKNIDKSNTFLLKTSKNVVNEFEEKIMSNDNALLFFMKEKSSINNINKIISFLERKNISSNIYIFDDEGDYASFNTKDNTIEEQEERSMIFNELVEMIKKDNVKYISITATPMIHVLSNNNNPLKPDYAFFLPKKYGYTGIEEFVDEINKQETKIFIPITEDCEEEILIISIILFFIKSLFVEKEIIELDSKDAKPLMIINPGQRRIVHEETKDYINDIINRILIDKKYTSEVITKYDIINYLDSSLINIIKEHNINSNEISEQITNHFKNRYKIIIFNSDTVEEEQMLDFENSNNMLRFVIGYQRLSRGVTFKNLLQAFVIYIPKQINLDNILQQCRWFGYRSKYIKHITLFMNWEYFFIYNQALTLTEDLYYRLKLLENDNKKFSEMERVMFLNHDFLYSDNDKLNVKATYRGRARQKMVDKGIPISYVIKNNFDTFDEVNDRMLYLESWFSNQKTMKDNNNYFFVEFNNFEDFSKSLINENNKDLSFFFGEKIRKIESELQNLNQKTIVRFINNSHNEIEWKERIQTDFNGSHIFWGNGTYKDSKKGLDSKDINFIDLLPLNVYGTDEEDNKFSYNLFRLKLNINQLLLKKIIQHKEESLAIVVPNKE